LSCDDSGFEQFKEDHEQGKNFHSIAALFRNSSEMLASLRPDMPNAAVKQSPFNKYPKNCARSESDSVCFILMQDTKKS